MAVVKIIAAVVNTAELVLYKEDGSTITILQGDPRVKRILDECLVPIKTMGFALIDLYGETVFSEYERKSNGLVRFFRMSKNALASIFKKAEPVEPMVVGFPPVQGSIQPMPVPGIPQTLIDEIRQNSEAIKEILKLGAIPSTAPSFGVDKTYKGDETIVAVTKGQVIQDVHKITPQFQRAMSTNTRGMEAFLARISEVNRHRQHSVTELMNFMERADLPVADDGSIIIYKVLRKRGEVYVDCHTGKVSQRIGSYVCMDEKLVDHNRRLECSVGLHVARRGYIRQFSGDVCVIAKVKPEDVITVPEGEPDKMRVCGYHILFELDAASYGMLKHDQPFTTNEKAQRLLGRAISGDHPGIIEIVKISGAMGQDVSVTLLDQKKEEKSSSKPIPTTPEPRTKEPVKTEALDATGERAPQVDPKGVAEQIQKTEQRVPEAAPKQFKPPTRQDQAKALYDAIMAAKTGSKEETEAAQALVLFKRKSKVSWGSLGMGSAELKDIDTILKTP